MTGVDRIVEDFRAAGTLAEKPLGVAPTKFALVKNVVSRSVDLCHASVFPFPPVRMPARIEHAVLVEDDRDTGGAHSVQRKLWNINSIRQNVQQGKSEPVLRKTALQ